MEWIVPPSGAPRRVAVLSGSFHPVTRAHLALAKAALAAVDVVVFAMPRAFPHKRYEGVGQSERLAILQAALAGEPRFTLGVFTGGLFIEMARECRPLLPSLKRLFFLCGRDAAERFLHWDYQEKESPARQLEEFELLVAPRKGAFEPPPALRSRVHPLPLSEDYEEDSATLVRRLIAEGKPWEHLVPEAASALIRRYYCEPPGGARI